MKRFSIAFLAALMVMLAACDASRNATDESISDEKTEERVAVLPPISELPAPNARESDGRKVLNPGITADATSGYQQTQALSIVQPDPEPVSREQYAHRDDQPFYATSDNPLSTFSIDVDAASYANMRRFLNQGMLPPADAVRIEEMINYFSYDYPQPGGNNPFALITEVGVAPWQAEHRIVHVGIQGRNLPEMERPASNLVFLLDVSGSMGAPNKLPLLKQAFSLLVEQLTEDDRVAIVVYAGAAGRVLPSTPGSEKATILEALERLEAGGSTAGAAGIELAYRTAQQHFIRGGNNRVILATDGDFNVGVSSDGELIRMIEDKRKQGTFLTVLGFGQGNLQDAKMEQIADHGNGTYYYIDSELEAKKVFVRELGGTLFTIAKDVKIQIEFNPAIVAGYRLIGYENRMLAAEDFADDTKDAGELGAGHTVTALYEIIPVGADSPVDLRRASATRYQDTTLSPEALASGEMMTLKLRYKAPDGDTSREIAHPVPFPTGSIASVTDNFTFSAAVATFGMVLRDSPFKGNATAEMALALAQEGQGDDAYGYRSEFIGLMERYQEIAATRAEW